MISQLDKRFLLGAVTLIFADQSCAAEKLPADAIAAEQLERVFVGVPTPLTLPPGLASSTDLVAEGARCDADADARASKGRRVARELEVTEGKCPSDPLVEEPVDDRTEEPNAFGQADP